MYFIKKFQVPSIYYSVKVIMFVSKAICSFIIYVFDYSRGLRILQVFNRDLIEWFLKVLEILSSDQR